MQMKKRVLSAFMALCMVCSLVGAAWAVIPQVEAASSNQFNIIWTSGSGWDKEEASVTVELYGINGEKLEGVVSSKTLSSGTPYNVTEKPPTVSEYVFDHAEIGYITYFGYDGSWEKIDNLSSSITATYSRRSWSYKYDSQDWNDWYGTPTIRLYYRPTGGGEDPDQGGTTTKNATVQTGKTAVLREDGNYDLTLSISGDRGSSSKKQAVDVLFILDLSNSMAEKWGQTTRIEAAKSAISQITGRGDEVGLSDNQNLDVQYALVGFGGGDSKNSAAYRDAGERQGWTASADDIYEEIPSVYNSGWYASNHYGGGTNYEAGFRTGKEVLEKGRSNALKVVIFISDGGPGYYYNNSGYTNGTGNPFNYDEEALEHAVNVCKTLNTDYFYFVGVTSDVTTTVFEDIVNAVPIAKTNKDSISANDPDDLLEGFSDIEQQITFFAAKDVTITDPLSEYADLVLTNNAPQFTVSVTDGTNTWSDTVAAGKSVTFYDADDNARTATPQVSNDKRIIYLDLPDNYELEPGYTYSISTVITPSALANSTGESGYDGIGEANTGTHSTDNGFWSNANAKVTYIANGEEGSENFPKPVIRVQNGSLTVTKCVKDYVPGEDYAVTIDVKDSSSRLVATVVLDDFTPDNGVYKASHTFGNLSAGTYTVTETVSGVLTGYKQTSTVVVGGEQSAYDPNDPPSVTITAGKTQNVTFTNSYDVDVTVEPVTPDIRKYVDDKEDGTYDLSLDVTGTTVKDTKKLNVLYILDESYSMMWDMPSEDEANNYYPYPTLPNTIGDESNESGDKYYYYASKYGKEGVTDSTGSGPIPYSYERYQAATSAINLLNETLDENGKLDVQYAMVEFAENSRQVTQWKDSESFNLPPAEYDTFTTGTNYGAAFNSAASLLNNLPSGYTDAETIVIFVTDGNPNRATLDGNGSTVQSQVGIDFAKQYIDDLNCDRFYAIGVSDDVGENYLTDLITAVQEGVNASVFQSNSTMELAQEFANMAAEITGSVTQNVTIVDELSEYAELVNVNASPVITITDANGEPVEVTPNNDFTVDPSGVATQTFTFSDRTNIDASSATTQTLTYHYYPEGQYDDGTNTHPVITLDFPDDYQLTQNWTYTITLQIQPTDAAYDEYAISGYNATGDPNTDVPGSAENTWTSSDKQGFHSNTNADLTYTNGDGKKETVGYPDPVIQVKFVDLVVAKEVTGNMGDTTQNFDFTLRLNRGETYYDNGLTLTGRGSTLTATDNTYSFQLMNGQSITIQVPARYAAQVAETTTNLGYTVYAGYDETDADKNNAGDYTYINTNENVNPVEITSLDKDYTVLFTNYRQVSTPTGFFEDNLPFTLMISAAGLAGIALIATILVRRQRRRRE